MKLFKLLVVTSGFSFGLFAFADNGSKAIFGEDNRKDIFEIADELKPLSSALGTWVTPYYIEQRSESVSELIFPVTGEHWGLCQGERFYEQPTTEIACTGFLVAPDLLLTAGHCMVNVGEARDRVTPQCSDFRWVFDYQMNSPASIDLKNHPNSSIAHCEKVIYAIHEERGSRKDYALIRLSAAMNERFVFPVAEKKVQVGDQVAMMGFPIGLPLKYSGDSEVLRLREGAEFFEASLDAAGGNSGSPVFNQERELVGILVRGNVDFVDTVDRCSQWNRCERNGQQCLDGDQGKDYNAGMHVQLINEELKELIRANSQL